MIHSYIGCVQSKRWLLVFYRDWPGKPTFYLKIAYAVFVGEIKFDTAQSYDEVRYFSECKHRK